MYKKDMRYMMKVLASDYDGTLKIKRDGVASITLSDKEAIAAWRKKGNKFGIVTGRSSATIKEEIKNNDLAIDFLICNNGGVVLDPSFEVLQLSLIDFALAQKLLTYIEQIDCNGYVLNDGYNRARKAFKPHHEDLHDMPSTITIEAMIASKQIAQIVVDFDDQEPANALAAYLTANYDGIEAFANIHCVDIVPRGCSKASGINCVIAQEHYDKKDVYAIGDNYNDVSMIQTFYGATFITLPKDIQEQAKVVVDSVASFITHIDTL